MAVRDYLLDAAQQIRMALDREVNEDYEAAFSYYKNGVDLLMNGVQVDPNKERREAVKRKTTQYLKRAEEIFISYLQDNISKGSSHLGGYSSLRFRSIRHLSSPVENLAMCRVIGVIDKVLTVESVISRETFIVKSLAKSSWESRDRSTIIPQGVPFMVKLLKYYISEDSVFLHLEHVQGGRLFTRLHKVRIKTVSVNPDCFNLNQHKIHMKNSYTLPNLSQKDDLKENSLDHQCLHSYSKVSQCLYAVRTQEPLASVGQRVTSLTQDNLPLPVHPCVIVDTRDPLDVTSDLLGNDVRIERMDSSIDLNGAWNDLEPDQNLRNFTVSGSVLGMDVAARITPASLFGEGAQVTLCSTVDVLPQRVRIVPNASHLPSQSQERSVHHTTPCENGHASQFVAELSVVNSPKQEGISLDITKMNLSYKSPESLLTQMGSDRDVVDGLSRNFSAESKRDGCGLPEEKVRLWGAQILLALESLHEQGIICQDLNPRNILLRDSGEACLTYFGQWTEVQTEICPTAVDQMYCAPEIGGVSKITEACDWWSFGAVLYELLSGLPLWRCHPSGIRPHTPLYIPDTLSTAAASLLTELLQFDACYRLGSGGGGVMDIKCHPFFNSVPWRRLSS